MKCPACGKWVTVGRPPERRIYQHHDGKGWKSKSTTLCYASGIRLYSAGRGPFPRKPQYIVPTPKGQLRRYTRDMEWKQRDEAAIARFWAIARNFGLKHGMSIDQAEDFAQEASLAFAVNGRVSFRLAKLGFWAKYQQKWQRIVNEFYQVETADAGQIKRKED